MSSGCTGHCCASFCIPQSPAQLAEMALDPDDLDAAFLRDALVDAELLFDGRWGYECRHFVRDEPGARTGRCSVYEARPAMCRDYPYGKPCTHPGCTLDPDARPDVVVGALLRRAR